MTTNRKLAAILAADVVGYSRLMQEDEAGTLAALKQRRKEILQPTVAQHRGRIIKVMGDGVLVEFASAVAAVQCAIELQQAMSAANSPNDANDQNRKTILLRIGVNLGDVIVEGSDLYGDGVNVAARLEAITEPGTICISGKVRDEVQGKIVLKLEDMGEVALKNMAHPVHVYCVSPPVKLKTSAVRGGNSLHLPEKPSIAVLPFQNLSGDPEQEYFADGVVEEIITALSRFHQLFVIARNSSFSYKGRAVDLKQVGRELGVRYLLEGSVRKVATRVRITGQLIDATTGAHLWADRFEGLLEDIFDLQDQVTASVVGAIAPKLEQAEIERALRKPTENLDAYDHFMRGMAAFHQWTREGNKEAVSQFHRAIAIDPSSAAAHAMAARCYPQRRASGWVVDGASEVTEAVRLARRAAELGANDALALCTAGFVLGFAAREPEKGAALIERALLLNPNLAWGWMYGGWVNVYLGDPETALKHIDRAIRLSPQDPQLFQMQTVAAFAHFFAGRYAEGVSWAERALLERSTRVSALRALAANCAMAGRREQASNAISRLRELDPSLRLSNLKEFFPVCRSEDLDRLVQALRLAGLPE
jgi:TolB-like protein/class 3 adenylate cyclase/Tfp pilus assembly protein PilF